MDHLSKSLARQISLKQGEDVLIAADPSLAVPDSTDHALYLVGRVVIDKELSLNALRANIRRLLNPVKGVDIRPLGSNKVLLKFDHPLDRKHALDGCPWAVERTPYFLNPWTWPSNRRSRSLNLYQLWFVSCICPNPIARNLWQSSLGIACELSLKFRNHLRTIIRPTFELKLQLTFQSR